MQITFLKDRIRFKAEVSAENEAVNAISDLVFFSPEWSPLLEDIANDHGCWVDPGNAENALNYCHTPLPMPPEEVENRCAGSQERN